MQRQNKDSNMTNYKVLNCQLHEDSTNWKTNVS